MPEYVQTQVALASFFGIMSVLFLGCHEMVSKRSRVYRWLCLVASSASAGAAVGSLFKIIQYVSAGYG